ncbi:ATP-grasp domain-containing protein [Paenibacillus woosongensis]|uniref:ATP-grasp domain-containing protein n=1 Tax=Paenibacillus woosongensis TaxID=307580 RepID=A0AA95I6X9_9BACL|nr:ATP-grasp domain-containing protein [Paenibacillus woosongensis]WHX48538.1 ATP-grasp domain-containing protein [Paenibacillus woosongensis]
MTKNVLVIGLNPKIVNIIENMADDIILFILEEKELYENNYLSFHSSICQEVRIGSYQQSLDCVDTAVRWNEEIRFDAVIPGREYSVIAVNEIAKRLGLRRLGDVAADSLTNKYKLRTVASKLGILQPRFAKIEQFEDLVQFYQSKPLMLKPVNRQASTGVIKIESKDDLALAWVETTNATEGNLVVTQRPLIWEYMSEDYVEGFEISVESFVKDGQVLFHNITKKLTTVGKYSVEIGHIIPGDIHEEIREEVIDAKQKLIQGLAVQNGLLHSEWIINEQGSFLIECAGRAPGGLIPELFELAYDLNLFKAYINVLLGLEVQFPSQFCHVAAAIYFTPPSGKLISVKGFDVLGNIPSIKRIESGFELGQLIEPLTSNWARKGYVVLQSTNYEQLEKTITEINETVKFEVSS